MRAVSMCALLVACGTAETPAPAPAPTPAPTPVVAPAPEPEPEPDFATLGPEDRHAHLMKVGETVYNTGGTSGIACKTCHMDQGQGAPPAFPPLAGAKDAIGDCATHARYIVKGLSGEIEVLGVKYNGVMPAQPTLTDLEIAAVMTFERNSWGNDYGDCAPEDVAAARTAP